MAALLEARGLPLSFAGAGVDDVLTLVERDKKRSGGRVPFVLVEVPARSAPVTRSRHDLRAAVEEVHIG